MTFYNQHSTALVGSGAENNQGGYTIERSLRFRSSASAYLNRTFTTPTNVLKWTWSGWVKIGGIPTYNPIFAGGTSGSAYAALWFNNGALVLYSYNGSTVYHLQTSAVYRDPSAWYHIQIAFDSSQATSSDRVKIYINGVQVTSFSVATYPSLNLSGYINSAIAHYVGQFTPAGVGYFNGYQTEINFIDGQALDPSYFGETDDDTGVWKPKAYGGTYGTNGFYLNFSDNTSTTTLGYDQSSNSNNWTTNNISLTAGSTYDSMLDVPTLTDADAGNFCTLNPLNKGTSLTVANGNLDFSASGTASNVFATMPFTNGKFYFEVTFSTVIAGSWGIATKDASITANIGGGSFTNFWGFYCNPGANYVRSGTNPWNNGTITTSSVGQIAVDATDSANVKMWIGINNAWYNSSGGTTGDPATGSNATETLTNNVDFFPFFGAGNATPSWSVNFGQRPFAYTPPTGYKALNTYNLPDPTIKDGSKHFDVRLWSADVSNPAAGDKSILLDFQPDLVWSKNRDNAESHYWMDSVRGNAGNKWLRSSSTAAEGGAAAVGATDCYYDFNSSGFDIIDTNSNYDEIYYNGRTYVGWCWKGGNTSGVSNTDGSITSTVSANTTSGFSIVTYTGIGGNGTGTTGSIGHGLGTTPAMLIVKARNYAWKWVVYHKDATPNNNQHLQLQSTANVTTSAYNFWDTSNLNSSTFGVGEQSDTNFNGANFVAYCFAPIEGYSAFGKYTGTGSTDGTFVYTGFRPAFVMMKRISVSGNWTIKDNSRPSYNSATGTLFAEDASVELTGYPVDFVSNGFKHRNAGYPNSAEQYIYMAFAENPFKYSLAR